MTEQQQTPGTSGSAGQPFAGSGAPTAADLTSPDPKDARIAELEAQLADRTSDPWPVHDQAGVKEPAEKAAPATYDASALVRIADTDHDSYGAFGHVIASRDTEVPVKEVDPETGKKVTVNKGSTVLTVALLGGSTVTAGADQVTDELVEPDPDED
jgi:hypothetical protein